MKSKVKIPATRAEAIQTGSKVYLGKPCHAGHHEGRNLSGGCIVCHRATVSKIYCDARDTQQAEWASQEARKPRLKPLPPLPDWMTLQPPKVKRIRRKAGESYAGEAEDNIAASFRDRTP